MSQFKEGDILQFKTHFNIRRIITEARSTGYSYLRSAADERNDWDTCIYVSEDTADPLFQDGWQLCNPQPV